MPTICLCCAPSGGSGESWGRSALGPRALGPEEAWIPCLSFLADEVETGSEAPHRVLRASDTDWTVMDAGSRP